MQIPAPTVRKLAHHLTIWRINQYLSLAAKHQAASAYPLGTSLTPAFQRWDKRVLDRSHRKMRILLRFRLATDVCNCKSLQPAANRSKH
jgi:hypothetical protein